MQGHKHIVGMIISLVALGLSTSSLAMSCGGCMSVPCGWFIEANAGYAELSNASLPGIVNSKGPGGNLNLGYKIMPYLGFEIGYSQYAGSSINDPVTGIQAGKAKHYSYDVAARAILPLSDSGFEALAKVGAARLATQISIHNQAAANSVGLTKTSSGSTGLYLGLGGQYYFMPEMAVVALWQRAYGNSKTGTEDLYSIGLSFIFD